MAGLSAHPRRSPRRLAGVLFDMDGTLLDSERIWDVALHERAAALGGSLSPEARAAMVGSNLRDSVAMLHADVGAADADPAVFAATASFMTERTAELFRTDLEWRPGARELLAAVQDAGILNALVTSTHRGLTEIALDTLGRGFAAVVCGDEVNEPKPAAESYLRAAELIGADPADCVSIEDSPTGVAAATAAGCAVLAVPSEVPIEPAPGRTVRDSLVGVTVADLAALL